MEDHKYLNFFGHVASMGAVSLNLLLIKYGCAKRAWEMIDNIDASRIDEKKIIELKKLKKEFDIENQYEKLLKMGIEIITTTDIRFSPLLKNINNCPPFLYYRGNPELMLEKELMAIVGTRRPSGYGIDVSKYFSKELTKKNVTLVSGLALGIDTIVHQTALASRGKTIAVLPGGLDDRSMYPQSNFNLMKEMINSGRGLLLSEFPPYSPAMKHHFVIRNRLISGLAQGTIVAEANIKSGSLITAAHALEQNREVYTIPGPIFLPSFEGNHHLIDQGAKLVAKIEDIYRSETDVVLKNAQVYPDLTPLEKQIIFHLKQPCDVDALSKKIEIPFNELQSRLTIMELQELITQNTVGQYFLNRNLT